VQADLGQARSIRIGGVAKVLGFALVLGGVGLVVLVGDESSLETASGGPAPARSEASRGLARITATSTSAASGSRLSIRSIESRSGAGVAQDFVIVFDGSVPDDRVSYVDDIAKADVARVAYTTQEWTPVQRTPLMTCGDAHFGFSPPAIVGQVDVLIPGDWFDVPPDADEITWTQHPEGSGMKTPLCGPHDGYVQFAIWSPSSHDPEHIQVYFADPTRLVIEIRPPPP
jgi:hypothetical protein